MASLSQSNSCIMTCPACQVCTVIHRICIAWESIAVFAIYWGIMVYNGQLLDILASQSFPIGVCAKDCGNIPKIVCLVVYFFKLQSMSACDVTVCYSRVRVNKPARRQSVWLDNQPYSIFHLLTQCPFFLAYTWTTTSLSVCSPYKATIWLQKT